MSEAKILIVDDEEAARYGMARALKSYSVAEAGSVDDARKAIASARPDLMILDINLPGMSGLDYLRELSASENAPPVVMITAHGSERTAVEAIKAGAYDYLAKPFDLGELVARARALIRRGKGVKQTTLRMGELALDLTGQSVQLAGKLLDLRPTEYRILEYLMHQPRRVVSKRELLEHMYDFTWEHHSNVIEAHVSNLRKKLRLTTDVAVLETLRGRGYRLTAEGAA